MPIFIGSAIIVTTLHCQNTVRFVKGPEKGEKHEEQVGGGERKSRRKSRSRREEY